MNSQYSGEIVDFYSSQDIPSGNVDNYTALSQDEMDELEPKFHGNAILWQNALPRSSIRW